MNRRFATGGWSGVGALAAVLVSAALLAACSSGAHPAGNPTGPGGGAGQPTPAGGGGDAVATVTTSPRRPTAQPTARHPGPRPTPPSDPAPPTLRPVAVPAACELNAPADGLQRSADAGHVPWRLDPAQVVLQCLRRGLGAAAWRISRIGEHAVAVSEPRSRLVARVRLEQPARHGPGGIWGVTAIDANRELILPPACIEPDAAALQASFDQGHQPWQGDPLTKAELCVTSAYGWRHAHGTLISANYVSVVDDTIGEAADVRGQRWRPGGDIWLVTSVQRDIGSD
jgi:hypothetical protein